MKSLPIRPQRWPSLFPIPIKYFDSGTIGELFAYHLRRKEACLRISPAEEHHRQEYKDAIDKVSLDRSPDPLKSLSRFKGIIWLRTIIRSVFAFTAATMNLSAYFATQPDRTGEW
jgi:hypothetical protein